MRQAYQHPVVVTQRFFLEAWFQAQQRVMVGARSQHGHAHKKTGSTLHARGVQRVKLQPTHKATRGQQQHITAAIEQGAGLAQRQRVTPR